MTERYGEYRDKGDYHEQLDPNWKYLPVYLTKMRQVERFLAGLPAGCRIVDLGCGEGVLVRRCRERGLDVTGVDLNYESEYVRRASLDRTGFEDGAFDVALCLDVIEHLSLLDQPPALAEAARILKPGGVFVLSVPNLAHFASRVTFLLAGRLLRTSEIERHPGDRPIKEYLNLLKPHFTVRSRRGLFPTFPLISLLTLWKPAKVAGLHRFYNTILGFPGISFLNILECVKKR